MTKLLSLKSSAVVLALVVATTNAVPLRLKEPSKEKSTAAVRPKTLSKGASTASPGPKTLRRAKSSKKGMSKKGNSSKGGDHGHDCVTASLYLVTDEAPEETYTSLINLNTGEVLWGAGVGLANSVYTATTGCMDPAACYEFRFTDSAGDGICCEYGQGYFDFRYDDVPVISGAAFGSEVIYYVGDGCI
jgi:hypothetical protein